MKKIIFIFFAMSLALLLLGFTIDWRQYLQGFQNLPNLLDILYEAREQIASIPAKWEQLRNVSVWDLPSFFNAIGLFFSSLGQSIWAIVIVIVWLPTKLLLYLFRVLFAFIPWQITRVDTESVKEVLRSMPLI